MYFSSSTTKIIQAASVLLRCEHKQMSYLRLLKLLYIADREALKEVGRPILGTRPVAMKHGPLHSIVYDLIKGQHLEEPLWSQYIERDRYQLKLVQDPGVGNLSRYEIKKLTDVCERYAHVDDWALAELTHEFAEWQKNYREHTAVPISLDDILDALGRSADKAAILQDAADEATYRQVFGS
jgi:uncharacterized phage-associated protein